MNKKIASEIAIGVILLVAIIIGGVFWLQNKAQAPVTAPVTTQPATVAQTPVTQPAVDETANWKTYTNTKYGFELKTPQDWEVKNEEKVYYDIESTDKIAQKMINFSVQKKNGTVTILTILITPTKNLKLCEDTPFCSPGEYIKQNNEFSFGFSSGLGVGVKENLQDDSAVLESFKFTDSAADETANWQTYTNTKYGYSIQLPIGRTVYSKVEKDQLIKATDNEKLVSIADNEELAKFSEPQLLQIEGIETSDSPSIWFDKNYTKYYSNSNRIQLKEVTNFSGKDALKVVGVGEGGPSGRHLVIVAKIDSGLVVITQDKSDLLDQILSTLKFTK